MLSFMRKFVDSLPHSPKDRMGSYAIAGGEQGFASLSISRLG